MITCAQFLLIQHVEMYMNLPSHKIMEFLEISLASGLQVVLKEIYIESRTISVHHGAPPPFVFSLDPLEMKRFLVPRG